MQNIEVLDKVKNLDDFSSANFKEYYATYKDISAYLEQHPEHAKEVYDATFELRKKDGFLPDLLIGNEVLAKAFDNLEDKDACARIDELQLLNERAFFSVCNSALKNKNVSEHLFNKLLGNKEIESSNVSLLLSAAKQLDNQDCLEKLKGNMQNSKELANMYFKSLYKAYTVDNSEKFFEILNDEKIKENLNKSTYNNFVFKNLEEVIAKNPDVSDKSFEIINEKISDCSEMNIESLYYSLDNIMSKNKSLEGECIKTAKFALKSNKNNRETLKKAYRITKDYEKLKSKSYVGQRIEKTDGNDLGWDDDVLMDLEKPCVLFLGGDATKSAQSANGYAKPIFDMMKTYNLGDDVNVYSAYYDFGDFLNEQTSRVLLMEENNRKSTRYRKSTNEDRLAKEDHCNPQYIEDLFNKAILPRISTNDGKEKQDINSAKKYIRKLNIVAHCHGAHVALRLEEKMQKKMKELNYSKEEMADIQKELLVVAHAPYCPLGVSKSTFVSFASANDMLLEHGNNFHQYVKKQRDNKDFSIAYFQNHGNLFLARQSMSEGSDDFGSDNEHNFSGYGTEGFTKEGQVLNKMAENIIVNGVKNSNLQKEDHVALSDVKTLCQAGHLFDKIKENGDKEYGKMILEMRAKNKMANTLA